MPGRDGGLDTAIQWSYDLLSKPGRLLFERLSAFAGGFTLDDAEAVAGDARLPTPGVAAHLSALVRPSSAVRLPPSATCSARWRTPRSGPPWRRCSPGCSPA